MLNHCLLHVDYSDDWDQVPAYLPVKQQGAPGGKGRQEKLVVQGNDKVANISCAKK